MAIQAHPRGFPGRVKQEDSDIMRRKKQVWLNLVLLLGGVALLFCPACSTTPGHTRTRNVTLTMTKRAPAVEAPSSPAAFYYFSLYNWLRHQPGRQARETALESLRKAVQADPDSLYLRLELAEQLMKNMKVEEARVNARAALELDPGNPRARRMLAGIYTVTGKPQAAIAQYQSLLRENPDNTEALFYLVALYVDTLQYEKALDLLKEYRRRHPEDVLGPFYMGKVYAELKLYKDAERYFKEAVKIDPEMPDAWFSLGLIYEYTGQQDKAVQAYRKLLEINGNDRHALERLGQLLVRSGNFDDALKIFKRLQAQGEVPVSISIKIALIYLQQGKYKEAAELLQKLHERYPNQARITFYLASCREAMKEPDEALKLFLKIPAGDDLYYDARIHAAFLYEERSDFAACENILRELIATYPEKAGLYRMLSSLRRKQGDEEGALKILEKARRQFPGDYKIRFALGVVYSDLGRYQDSVRVMQELLKENPEDATVLNFIGYTYVEQGVQLDDAEKLLDKALRLKPDSGFILDSVGWLQFVKGNYEKALDYLKQAAQKVPDDPVIFEHLGDTYVKLGRLDEARESYRHSLKIKASKKVREKLEKLLQNEK